MLNFEASCLIAMVPLSCRHLMVPFIKPAFTGFIFQPRLTSARVIPASAWVNVGGNCCRGRLDHGLRKSAGSGHRQLEMPRWQ